MGITGVVSFLVLFYVGSGQHVWQLRSDGTALPPLADGLVGGAFAAGAACAAIATWRKHAGPMKAWVIAAGALVAGQSLLVTILALEDVPPRGSVSLALIGPACLRQVAIAAHAAPAANAPPTMPSASEGNTAPSDSSCQTCCPDPT